MATEQTSSADRRRYVNAERVAAALQLDLGGAQKKETIPYVFAVMSNLHGNCRSKEESENRKKLVEKNLKELFKLQEVCQLSDFNALFTKFKPQFYKSVKNRLAKEGPELAVELDFKSMGEFLPEKIAANVPAIRERLRLRDAIQRTRDRVGALTAAQSKLNDAFEDPDFLQSIQSESAE